jgi:hypothetical protein
VTRDNGTSKGALIARGRNYDHAPPDGMIERFFQRLFPSVGRNGERKAQVNYSCTCVDALDDCFR